MCTHTPKGVVVMAILGQLSWPQWWTVKNNHDVSVYKTDVCAYTKGCCGYGYMKPVIMATMVDC